MFYCDYLLRCLFFTFSLSLSFQPRTVPEWSLGGHLVYLCANLPLQNAYGQDIATQDLFLCADTISITWELLKEKNLSPTPETAS